MTQENKFLTIFLFATLGATLLASDSPNLYRRKKTPWDQGMALRALSFSPLFPRHEDNNTLVSPRHGHNNTPVSPRQGYNNTPATIARELSPYQEALPEESANSPVIHKPLPRCLPPTKESAFFFRKTYNNQTLNNWRTEEKSQQVSFNNCHTTERSQQVTPDNWREHAAPANGNANNIVILPTANELRAQTQRKEARARHRRNK